MSSSEPAAAVIGALRERGLTIAAAESLTGGELTAALTAVPGASAVVLGGAVVYATALKHELLGVDAELLRAEGPVHPEVARQLASGVRARLATDGRPADIGIATTGVAGPEPQGGQPVGTVYLGVATAGGVRAVRLMLAGDRAQIRRQTVVHALDELAVELGMSPAAPGESTGFERGE